MNMSLTNIAQLCTGLALDSHQVFGNSSKILRSQALVTLSEIYEAFENTSVFNMLPYLDIKQVATLKYSANAKYFLESLEDLIQMKSSSNDMKMYESRTILSILQEINTDPENLQDLLNGFIGNSHVLGLLKSKSISYISKMLDKMDPMKLKLNILFRQMSLGYNQKYSVFSEYKSSQQSCEFVKKDVTFEEMAIKCKMDVSYLQYIDDYGKIFTPQNVIDMEKIDGSKYNVELMHYFSMIVYGQYEANQIVKRAEKPLIQLAFEKGITLENLIKTNLVSTSMNIFDVHRDVLAKIFKIEASTINLASSIPLSSIPQHADGIDKVEQIYTVSMKLVYAVVAGNVTGEYALANEFPKFVMMISKFNFFMLKDLYNKNDSNEFETYSLISLAMELFGMTEIQSQTILNLSENELKILKKRTIKDILELRSYVNQKSNISVTSPFELTNFVLGLDINLQDLLLSTLFKLAEATGDKNNIYGLVEGLLPNATTIVNQFLTHTLNGRTGDVPIAKFIEMFYKLNITKISSMFNESVENFAKQTTLGQFIPLANTGEFGFSF